MKLLSLLHWKCTSSQWGRSETNSFEWKKYRQHYVLNITCVKEYNRVKSHSLLCFEYYMQYRIKWVKKSLNYTKGFGLIKQLTFDNTSLTWFPKKTLIVDGSQEWLTNFPTIGKIAAPMSANFKGDPGEMLSSDWNYTYQSFYFDYTVV